MVKKQNRNQRVPKYQIAEYTTTYTTYSANLLDIDETSLEPDSIGTLMKSRRKR